jgi:hypothetical protein
MQDRKTENFLPLLFGGVGLAVIAAFFFPVLHFRGTDKALLGISSWAAVPLMTVLKLAVLALAVAAAFLPQLARLRAPIMVGAALMVFVPALGALVAGVYPWSDVRAEIATLSGQKQPWVDPGWGFVALGVASLLLAGAASRANREEPPLAR